MKTKEQLEQELEVLRYKVQMALRTMSEQLAEAENEAAEAQQEQSKAVAVGVKEYWLSLKGYAKGKCVAFKLCQNILK